MDPAASYTHRRHAFESEKTIAIEGAALILREGTAPERRLKLADVARVRLAFEPTRVQDGLYTCRIWAKGQMSPWTVIHSDSYRGILDFEPRAAVYGAFVRALNDAVLAHNPGAAFEAGASVGGYAASAAVLALASIAFVAVALITQGEGWSEITWTKLFLVIGMIPLGVIWFRRNWPRRYDPRALPEDLLPSV